MLPRNHPDRIQITFDDRRLVANAGLEDNYDRFFNYRCRAIARELAKNLIPQEIDEQVQIPTQDDFEDLETAQRQGLDADEE